MSVVIPWSFVSRIPTEVASPNVIEDVSNVRVTIYVAFVGFTILIWDHIVTFPDENRYSTPFIFILNLFGAHFTTDKETGSQLTSGTAYLSPSWTPDILINLNPRGATTIIGINITMLMMLIRVAALYDNGRLVVGSLVACLSLEIACSMVFDSSVGLWASLAAFLPLIYDTIILILTLNRTVGAVRRKTAGRIVMLLLRDGILYYSVIFAITLVYTIMIVSAPPGLQNVAAHLTVTMGSRIMLHLREQANKRHFLGSISGLDSMDSSSTISSIILLRNLVVRPQNSQGIVLEQSSVVHDDEGHVMGRYGASPSKQSHAASPDWHELTSCRPQAVELVRGRKSGARDSRSSY
ncbi:hypothetical protein BDY19DRAFT_906509 [Irpex rosettiformis]|uniref:Uncharacterized protein n=1 Tax=Irpex rosettiformis TaxID=378272 RepID=A0ACB8U2R3_9APHY|nr:hypothetical protein BDY19DRAFT_906509 [Irpex rosettiformis]